MIKILRTDLSTEIFQEIIEILLDDNEQLENNDNNNNNNEESPVITEKLLWFKAFSEIDRFTLMLSFLDQSIRERILTYLSSEKCITSCSSITEVEREGIIRKYTLSK